MPGASLGVHCHKAGLLPMLVRLYPCKSSVGRKPKEKYNVPNENQITEVRPTLRQILMTWFSHKEVGTHSLQSGFSMEILLARVYPETIMIIGRWSSNAFLRYIRIQVTDLSKGISNLILST